MGRQKSKKIKNLKEGQKEVKVSLSLKLTLIVVLLSIVIIVSLFNINIYWQNEKEIIFFTD